MTVCIAALADAGKSLVLVSDSMLSTVEVSGDKIANKYFPLSDRYQWWAMIAAEDVTHVMPIIEAALPLLLRMTDETNTCDYVERTMIAAYKYVRLRYAEDLVLAPIGLTLDELKNGLWNSELIGRLNDVNLGCEFLIAGFDWSGHGYVFSIEHPGIARNHNVTGYAAIGSGAFGAISSLLFQSLNYEMELAKVLYHVCEAKFMAESAIGVGRHTHVKVAKSGGRMDPYELSDQLMTAIRGDWEEYGKPRVPQGTIERLRHYLVEIPKSAVKSDPQSTTADPSRQPPSQE